MECFCNEAGLVATRQFLIRDAPLAGLGSGKQQLPLSCTILLDPDSPRSCPKCMFCPIVKNCSLKKKAIRGKPVECWGVKSAHHLKVVQSFTEQMW